MYFINEKEAVKFLVDFVLPYLNADKPNENELDDLFKAFATKDELKLFDEYKEKTFIESTNEPLTPESEKEILEKFLIEEPKEVIVRKNDIFKKLFSTKYKDRCKALINLQNESLKICVNLKDSDKNSLSYDLKENELLNNTLSIFDSFMVWLLKTPLYKSLAIDRRINFLDVYYIPKETKNYKEHIYGVYELYIHELESYLADIPKLDFIGYGNTNTYVISSRIDNVFNIIKKITSHAVLKCLYSYHNKEYYSDETLETIKLIRNNASIEDIEKTLPKPIDDYIIKGEGFNFIGLCPVCGKLFHKTRKDKECDTAKCSAIIGMRKTRAKI